MIIRHLIIGHGAAGLSAAEEIRRRDPTAAITLVGDEPYPLYSRPGLAYLLMGEISEPRVFCRTPEYYAEWRLQLVHGRAVSLDLAQRKVVLADGRTLPFDRLLLATGATAVPAPFPGGNLDGVVYLDTLKNAKDLLRRIQTGAGSAVVVGGGITAMELAEGLRHRGLEVHYLVRKKTIWSALLVDAESSLIEKHALTQGIAIHYNEEIKEIIGTNGRVSAVRTTGGKEIRCQIVGVAIGVRPNLGLAQAAAIQVDRGILVDEYLESSAPGVFAAGDVAQVVDHWTGEKHVDDLWPSAIAAGRAAGANMTGAHKPYVKSAPFNAALVFGVHLTSIGQAGAGRHDQDDANEMLQYQSRGSSEIWWARPGAHYASAWSHEGDNSLRLVLRGNVIAGAVILGNQDLADPLRELIGQRVDISPIRSSLQTDDPDLAQRVRAFWHARPCQ